MSTNLKSIIFCLLLTDCHKNCLSFLYQVQRIVYYNLVLGMEQKRRDRSRSSSRHNSTNTRQKHLCLNPDCSSPSRYFISSRGRAQTSEQCTHNSCKGWCMSINDLKKMSASNCQSKTSGKIDFLEEPIKSLFEVNSQLNDTWQEQVLRICESIRSELNNTLGKVLDDCLMKMYSKSQKMIGVHQNLQTILKSDPQDVWSQQHQQFYKQRMQRQLREFNKIGFLKLFNYEAVASQVDKIKEQIGQIEWSFFQTESEFDRSEREFRIRCKEELQSWEQASKEEVHTRIQRIHSVMKLRPLTMEELGDKTSTRCGKCNHKVSSFAATKQLRRTECHYNILRHMCLSHEQEVLESCINKERNSYQMSFGELLREITGIKMRDFVMIDRQNVNNERESWSGDGEVYCLEVVSKGRENLASGRYLVAESTGKDAADILIILALLQVGRVARGARITLVTKDHFGLTMQPILEALGVRVQIVSKWIRRTELGNPVSQVIMIDEV